LRFIDSWLAHNWARALERIVPSYFYVHKIYNMATFRSERRTRRISVTFSIIRRGSPVQEPPPSCTGNTCRKRVSALFVELSNDVLKNRMPSIVNCKENAKMDEQDDPG